MSGLHTSTTGARVAAMPRFAARAYPRLACGSMTPRRDAGRSVATEPSVGAVVDHHDLGRAGGVVGEQRVDAVGEQRARLVVDDDRRPGGARRPSRTKRNFTSA